MKKQEKLAQQPVSSIEWISRDKLTANLYNPNNVFPPELDLLRTSLKEDGWTLPLVVTPGNEIIDGFHRWMLSEEKEIFALTDGMVPIVRLKKDNLAEQMGSTIRYNRARGVHGVVRMADIVNQLVAEMGITHEEVMRLLGMEQVEVDLFIDRGNMLKRGSEEEFGKGWKPGKAES